MSLHIVGGNRNKFFQSARRLFDMPFGIISNRQVEINGCRTEIKGNGLFIGRNGELSMAFSEKAVSFHFVSQCLFRGRRAKKNVMTKGRLRKEKSKPAYGHQK